MATSSLKEGRTNPRRLIVADGHLLDDGPIYVEQGDTMRMQLALMGVTANRDEHARITGGLTDRNMLARKFHSAIEDEKCFPFDFLRLLETEEMQHHSLSDLVNSEGHTVLHTMIIRGRYDLFPVLFWSRQWKSICTQKIHEGLGSKFTGLTPKDIAEKLLPKTKGPELLDAFNFFDDLDNSLSTLHCACWSGEKKTVEQFLYREPSSLHVSDLNGFNCIAYAIFNGDIDVLGLLLRSEAQMTVVNQKQQTLLHLAGFLGRSHIFEFLLDRCRIDPSLEDTQQYRAIHYAALNGDIASMKEFIRCGVTPDGMCIALAAKHRRLEMVKFLLEQCGLPVDGRDPEGKTALLHAAVNGDIRLAQYVLAKGGNIKDKDKQQRNVFHLAIDSKRKAIVDMLLTDAKEKACLPKLLNTKDHFVGRDIVTLVRGRDRGQSAWHYVEVKRSRRNLFLHQLSRGAIDVKVFGHILKSGFGRYPDESKREEIDKTLNDRLADDYTPDLTPVHLAILNGLDDVISKLLKHGSDSNAPDVFGNTPLHLAAMTGNIFAAKCLEDYGSKFDKINCDGEIPAITADKNFNNEVENFIVSKNVKKVIKTARDTILQRIDSDLLDHTLDVVRNKGSDVKKHCVATLRDITIDVNEALQSLGSGPVMEESRHH